MGSGGSDNVGGGSSMEVIDDQGRLFGTVNIIDTLVVLLVLAVGIAGITLVVGGGESEGSTTTTTNVTLDLGTHPDYIVKAINEGDTHSPSSGSQLTVTDVHLAPKANGTRAIVRVELEGTPSGESVAYDGAPPRLGRTLEITTNRYDIRGQVRAVGGDRSLERTETTVVVRDTISAADAEAVSAGDELGRGGRTFGTIQNVAAYATEDPSQRVVHVEATLSGYSQRGDIRYGGQPVQRGQTLHLADDEYTISGTIQRVGGGLDRGQTVVLLEDTVSPETANNLAEGDTAIVAGSTTGTVEEVTLYGTNGSTQRRAYVGLSLSTVGYGESPRFGTTPIETGRSLRFQTEEYTVSGSIERVGSVEQRGTTGMRTVRLRMENVREEYASTINSGMVERSNGETVAEVTTVEVEPSTIIIRGDDGSLGVEDHPFERDVTVTAKLRVRETSNTIWFKGRPVRQRGTLALDFDSISVRGTVISIR